VLADGKRTYREADAHDHVGKVFVAVASGMRKCLICGSLFTWRGADEHGTTVCHPLEEDSGLDGECEHANR
jgi:hypothetical protein